MSIGRPRIKNPKSMRKLAKQRHMTVAQYREHQKLYLRKWRAKHREAYNAYQRNYQLNYTRPSRRK